MAGGGGQRARPRATHSAGKCCSRGSRLRYVAAESALATDDSSAPTTRLPANVLTPLTNQCNFIKLLFTRLLLVAIILLGSVLLDKKHFFFVRSKY